MTEIVETRNSFSQIFFSHEADKAMRLTREYENQGKKVDVTHVSGYLQMYNPNKYWSFNILFKSPLPVERKAIVDKVDESLGIEYSHSAYSDFIILKVDEKDN